MYIHKTTPHCLHFQRFRASQNLTEATYISLARKVTILMLNLSHLSLPWGTIIPCAIDYWGMSCSMDGPFCGIPYRKSLFYRKAHINVSQNLILVAGIIYLCKCIFYSKAMQILRAEASKVQQKKHENYCFLQGTKNGALMFRFPICKISTSIL